MSVYVFICECGKQVKGESETVCPHCKAKLVVDIEHRTQGYVAPMWAKYAAGAVEKSGKK